MTRDSDRAAQGSKAYALLCWKVQETAYLELGASGAVIAGRYQ